MENKLESSGSHEQHALSIISTDYLVRAVDLWQVLVWDLPSEATSELGGGVRVASLESSFAASICLLSLVGFDGALARCKTLWEIEKRKTWKDLVSELAPGIPENLAMALCELEILRDALAHNHVWRERYLLNPEGQDNFLGAGMQPGFGDMKFHKHVDAESRRTTGPLKLRVIPTNLTRQDALTVLGAIWFILQEIAGVLGQGMVATQVLQVRERPTRDSVQHPISFEDWIKNQLKSHKRAERTLETLMT